MFYECCSEAALDVLVTYSQRIDAEDTPWHYLKGVARVTLRPRPIHQFESRSPKSRGNSMEQQASDLYEPNSRYLHVASSVCDGPCQLIVWGGVTSEFYSNDGRIQLASVGEQFDIHSEVWYQRDTGGTPHPGLSDTACTSFGLRLFTYGGYCENTSSNISGALSCLDLTTLIWSQLSLAGGTAWGPMKKAGCGIVHFHHDKLAVIGGYGIPTGPTQPGSSFIKDTDETDGSGWTNEIHVFDISQGSDSQVH